VLYNEDYIVERAVEGDQGAFTQLYDLYFDKVYKYMYFRIRRQVESEDLTQEVFIKALKAIGSYKPGKTPFAAWIFRIAHNQMIDFVRKKDKYKSTSIDEVTYVVGNEDPVSDAERNMEVEELSAAIEELPPAQQEVISLRFIAGLSISEVAKIAGKSEGTVKALQFNATISLRKILVGKLEWQSE
jgi:RNA polymerase sigma-70 factor (ECF subfamily)